jgi:hypothetical protein
MHGFRLLTFATLASMVLAASSDENMVTGPVTVKSLSKLTFGPDGVLFVADSIGARIWALDLDDRTPSGEVKPLEINDMEGKLAGMLGADPRDVMIHDMAVNPISKNAYLTVSRGRRSFTEQGLLPNDVANASVLLRVTPSGKIEEVRLNRVKRSFVDLVNPIDEKVTSEFKRSKARVDAISDMAFVSGKLIIAGLSNEEFSSTLRIYPFPFDGKGSSTSIEIYHGSHGRYETNSPVRAFLPIEIKGKQYIMASYLCTPLVLFPMDELKDKQHLKGQTIAELGNGNYPLDMVAFQYKGKERIMVVNSSRGVVLIDADDLSKPLPSITTPIEGTGGIPFQLRANRGILQAENFGAKNLLVLSRNVINGEVSLWTMPIALD